jgi:hypothetical protein
MATAANVSATASPVAAAAAAAPGGHRRNVKRAEH